MGKLWISRLATIAILAGLAGCGPESAARGGSEVPTDTPTPHLILSPDPAQIALITQIRAAVVVEHPTVEDYTTELPSVGLGVGAKVTLATSPVELGDCVFIGESSDPFQIRGGDGQTEYLGGTGAVVCNGRSVYLFYFPEEWLAWTPAGGWPATPTPVRTYQSDNPVATAGTLNGPVIAWGDNDTRQVEPPSDLSHVTTVSAGYWHAVALKSDGTVVTWGMNAFGEIPVPPGLSRVTAVSAGCFFTLALKSDGTVVAWGIDREHEIEVPASLSDVGAISAGGRVSLALRRDGTIVQWGETSLAPAGLSKVVAVSAGEVGGMALESDGTVVGWGWQADVPSGLSGVKAISAGAYHALALKSDGTVVAWGDDRYGQTEVPPGLKDVVQIAAGGTFSLALKSDGTVVAWGVRYLPTNLPRLRSIDAGWGFGLGLPANN